MKKVVVLGTGGTIATRVDGAGVRRATDHGAQVLTGVTVDASVETRDVLVTNSFLLTPVDMMTIAHAVRAALLDLEVSGIVITHGTDTMEETAYLLDLLHDDDRPVVLTGAQRAADTPSPDGPQNLVDAVTVAADEKARGLGVAIVFDGAVYAARGTRKTHTLRRDAFTNAESGPIGEVSYGQVTIHNTPVRAKPLDFETLDLSGLRVDIVSFYPGADPTALAAFRDAGASAVVLEATGAGNATPQFADEIASMTREDVIVALSTRVDSGPVAGIYGNGGGVDLLAAGAVSLGTLRPPQGRILLMLLLAGPRSVDDVRSELPRFVNP